MSNPNPVTKFSKGNTFGSSRKRRVVSEKMLREALARSGEKALLFLEDIFNSSSEETKNRIQAVSVWGKLVFLQPKDDGVETIKDVKLTAQQHEEFNEFLIGLGIPKDKVGFEKEIMLKASEFLKKISEAQNINEDTDDCDLDE